MDIIYRPIGVIHSPFTDLKEMPIQPASAASASGWAEVFPEFADGLRDLVGFSHIILVYHLHQALRMDLTVTPFLGLEKRGILPRGRPPGPTQSACPSSNCLGWMVTGSG